MTTTPSFPEPVLIPNTCKAEVMRLMKTALRHLVTLIAFCLACTALALAAADAPDGAAIFKAKCSMCHGPDGKGYPAVKTPDFTDSKWQASMTDQKIADTIKNGKPNTMMMPFGNQLKDADIDALVRQIRSFDSSKKK
jgi:mono/diheme cytochrome c family protein